MGKIEDSLSATIRNEVKEMDTKLLEAKGSILDQRKTVEMHEF